MTKTAAAVTGFVAKLRMLFLTYVGVIIKIFSYGVEEILHRIFNLGRFRS